MSSQLGTQKSKKGAAPLVERRWFRYTGQSMLLFALAGLLVCSLTDVKNGTAPAVFGLMAVVAMTMFMMHADHEEKRREELQKLVEEFPAADFVQEMNKFGVETIIGGAPFDSAEIKLRFPGSVLQKHLAEAMMDGYKEGLREQGRRLGPNNEVERGQQFQHRSASWIEQMTRGQR